MYLRATGLIKSVVKSHWLTRTETAEWDERYTTALLSKATGSQAHVRYEMWTISRGKMIYKHFPLVTKDKQNYGLKKMNAVFIVSHLWIPFNKCTSSNSHKNEMRLYKWLAAGRGLLINDGYLLYRMAFFSNSTFWERREKGYCTFHVPWTVCHSFCLSYTTGLRLVATLGF